MSECYNSVSFNGIRKDELLNAIKEFEKNKGTCLGINKILDSLKQETGSFKEVCEFEVNESWLKYVTRWFPNINELIAIAKEFQVNFDIGYDEESEPLYGCASYSYQNDILTQYELDWHDYEQVSFPKMGDDDYSGECMLEGIEYTCDIEAYDILLGRKIKNQKRFEIINLILTPKRRGKQKKPTKADIIEKLFEFDYYYKSFSFSKLNRKRKHELELLLLDATKATTLKIAA